LAGRVSTHKFDLCASINALDSVGNLQPLQTVSTTIM